jgi:hypothetical protein
MVSAHQLRSRRYTLVSSIVSAFLCLLAQLQAFTLPHDHHGDTPPRVRAELLFFPPALYIFSPSLCSSSSYVTDACHQRLHLGKQSTARPPAVSLYPEAIPTNFWHTFSSLDSLSVVSEMPWLPALAVHPLLPEKRLFLLALFFFDFQPRAPPVGLV